MKKFFLLLTFCCIYNTVSHSMTKENEFLEAAENNMQDEFKKLIDQVDVNVKDGYERTALNLASYFGHEDIVKLLLEKSTIQLDIEDDSGWTALMQAAESGRSINVIKWLTEKGANLNKQSKVNFFDVKKGDTALMIAMRSDHADIAKILIEAGADLALKNDAGETALDIAQEKRHQDIINLLEKKLAEPATQPLQSALQVLQHHLSNVSKALKRT